MLHVNTLETDNYSVHITNRYRMITVHKFGRFMQKFFSRSSRVVNYAVVRNLLNAKKYFTIPKAIFTFSYQHDLRAQLGLPRYFYNLVSVPPSRDSSRSVSQTHACIKRGKNLTDGIALLVG